MLTSLFRGGDIRDIIISMLTTLPVILLSLSFHEFGHAWTANRCGDPTARMMGRLTLNPLRHLDPMGFVMMLLVGFGYAKPVPVNPNNFKHKRRDDFMVSIAGVTCNLILAVVGTLLSMVFFYCTYVAKIPLFHASWMGVVYNMVESLIIINLSLMVFNLLPVPPLDGYHVWNDILFGRRLFAPQVASQIGMGILLVLMMTGMLDKFMSFTIGHLLSGLNRMAGAIFQFIGVV